MPYDISIDKEGDYIRVDLYDDFTQSDITGAMQKVLVIRKEQNLNRILCDQRKLQVPPNDTVGFMTAEQFGTLDYAGTKLAIIRKQVKKERLFEIAAQNRGVNVKIFKNEKKAKKWLSRS